MATEPETSSGGGRQTRASGYVRDKGSPEKLADKAVGAVEEAKQRGKAGIEQGKDMAAGQAQKLGDAMGEVAARLQDQNSTLAGYAGQLANGMTRLADNLRNRSVDELAADTQALARRNPALFLLGSVALGIALSRFMKLSLARSQGAGKSSAAMQEDSTSRRDSTASPTLDNPAFADPGLEDHTLTDPAMRPATPGRPDMKSERL